MRLQKKLEPIVKVPIRGHNGFYRCPCGNILPGYICQTGCDACGAEFDWDSVLVSSAELEQDKQDRKVGRSRKCRT